jgi:D-alanyl-D-alanine carboxypeptidase
MQALRSILGELADVGGPGPGAILDVRWPARELHFGEAAGHFARGSTRALEPTDAFRIASMSKPITAAATLRLVEQGVLGLDDRLPERLPEDVVARVPRGREVTLRQLLSHTAGLWDFAMSGEWAREVQREPGRFRPPNEILDWALAHGEPIGAPGERFHYSDTGYVIVGHVLERATGSSVAALSRELVLEPLGMHETWLEGHEEPRGPELSHTYVGEQDGLEIHGSVDWAAGGHVSNVRDLERFLRGVLGGALFEHSETLRQMLSTVDAGERGGYGLGLGVRENDGVRWIGHAGFWGSFMYLLPESDVSIVGTVNRTGFDRVDLITGIPKALGLT